MENKIQKNEEYIVENNEQLNNIIDKYLVEERAINA
jgi:hypothetical protein